MNSSLLNTYILGGILILLVVYTLIMFVLTLRNTLREIAPKNRFLAPNHTWWLIVPFVLVTLNFIFIPKICKSIKAEYKDRGLSTVSDFGKNNGFAYSLFCVLAYIPYYETLISIVGLVIFISWWTKINNLKKTLLKTRDLQQDLFHSNDDLLD